MHVADKRPVHGRSQHVASQGRGPQGDGPPVPSQRRDAHLVHFALVAMTVLHSSGTRPRGK